MEVKKILVSQPAPAVPEKSPFHEVATKHSVTVDFKPFIKIEGVSLKEFRSQRIEILQHTAIIFTSRSTIDSFFRIAEESRTTIPVTMKYFCITEAVALYLQKYIAYRKRKLFFANGNFNNFMELLLKHKDEKYMLTLAEPHNPEIPSTLERLKFDFHPVVLAKTVSNDLSGVKLDDYQLLALYSPMEIQTLTATFGTENLPMVVTFGENAARAAAEANLHLVCAAPTPEAPSMAKAVDNTIALIKAGKKIEPVVLSGTSKSEEFIKAQEAKPTKRTRAKRKPTEE